MPDAGSGQSESPKHVPVLLDHVIDLLAVDGPGWIYGDATAGFGGHAAAVAQGLLDLAGPGTVVLNDMDPGNLIEAEDRVRRALDGREDVAIEAIHGNFADLPRALVSRGLGPAHLLLADLGFASNHVDDASRGFSFRRDGPLDMRLDPGLEVTAAEIVNTWPERDLADLIKRYGEEPRGRRIAAAIVAAREQTPIETTAQLADLIRSELGRAVGRGGGSIDQATLTFQALRIVVNDELGSLERLLGAIERQAGAAGSGRWLAPGARVGVISFHSLEDRLVKRSFGGLVDAGQAERVTRKPATAGEAETAANPRSRSAKLRVIALR